MRISDVSIDVGTEGNESFTVYVHNMSSDNFDLWEDKMTNVRRNNRNRDGASYRSGNMDIGGLGLTIFEKIGEE